MWRIIEPETNNLQKQFNMFLVILLKRKKRAKKLVKNVKYSWKMMEKKLIAIFEKYKTNETVTQRKKIVHAGSKRNNTNI